MTVSMSKSAPVHVHPSFTADRGTLALWAHRRGEHNRVPSLVCQECRVPATTPDMPACTVTGCSARYNAALAQVPGCTGIEFLDHATADLPAHDCVLVDGTRPGIDY